MIMSEAGASSGMSLARPQTRSNNEPVEGSAQRLLD
jgi:hypothetical protein